MRLDRTRHYITIAVFAAGAIALASACGDGASKPATVSTGGAAGAPVGGRAGGPAAGSAGGPAAGSAGAVATGSAGEQGGVGGGMGGVSGSGGSAGMPGPPPLCRIEMTCAESFSEERPNGPDAPKIPCTFRVEDGAGAVVYSDHAGVELRGRTSLRYPKKNYALELRTVDGAEHPENLFGMGQEADWILDGSWVDRSFMRNDLVFALFRDAGYYAPESRYCTLALNGEERGIYRLVERIKRDDDRLDLAEDDGNGASFVIKQDEQGVLEFEVGLESRWEMVYPRQDVATAAQSAGVQSFLDALDAALAARATSSTTDGVFELLDFDATVDWILIEELSKNVDAYNLSVYLARSAGGRARVVPWDLDLSFGQPTVEDEANESPEGWILGRTELIEDLAAVPALRARLGPRWRELREGPLATARILAKLDAFRATLIPSAIEANFAIWPLDAIDFTQIYRPYSLYRVTSYDDELAKLRAWIEARLSFLDANIDTYPD